MILPEDIEKQQFEVSFRGYSTREVDEFLSKLHTELEEILAEQELLKRKIAAAELIAKDAKDHEEEFIASIQDDKDKSEAALAAAKAEGERIIREAKNAASGIMAEVRRRAGDISSESRKASADIMDQAKAEAEELRAAAEAQAEELISAANAEAERITAAAKAAADKKMYAARTEAENILRAAKTEADNLTEEAAANAAEVTHRAAEASKTHEAYIREVRSAAEKLCFEIDTELKNSASRIALLGRRIASVDLPERAEVAPEPDVKIAPKKAEETPARKVPAHAAAEPETVPEPEEAVEDIPAEDNGEKNGYFSQEYRQAMAELFGEDADTYAPAASVTEDDDTYDFLDHTQIIYGDNESEGDGDSDEFDDSDNLEIFGTGEDEDEDEVDGDDTVTAEYTGIPASGKSGDLHDIFSDDALERIYGTPSKDDIDDILNGH